MAICHIATRRKQSSRLGPGVVFASSALIALFFVFTEHRVHLFGGLPFLLLACRWYIFSMGAGTLQDTRRMRSIPRMVASHPRRPALSDRAGMSRITTTKVFLEERSIDHSAAHADAHQIVEWLRSAPAAPRSVFVTHGEPGPADAMRQCIELELTWSANVPRLGQRVEIVT
ncbi:metallo-beta-lactamase [Burkholderia contaminans]|uniref:MBL fold metallo-hydrolase RNA specificity domain-containing protein n=1 Tax=Burkholderia contaminans TaxID=488447 RepID=UPI0014539213|nr:MBL fold metallo-hydrolase RNA specificity domain-containing protein [Burkholderia contaminans]VWC92124.1 metallo-beta-lactamase [Burkholderia contaminans]